MAKPCLNRRNNDQSGIENHIFGLRIPQQNWKEKLKWWQYATCVWRFKLKYDYIFCSQDILQICEKENFKIWKAYNETRVNWGCCYALLKQRIYCTNNNLHNQRTAKGTMSRDFRTSVFFSPTNLSWATDYHPKIFSNLVSIMPRYLRVQYCMCQLCAICGIAQSQFPKL
jgi:hypothetical protein